jgi:hypothetical protein
MRATGEHRIWWYHGWNIVAVCVLAGIASNGSLGLGIILAGWGGAFWPVLAAAIAVEFGAGAVGRVFGLVTFFLPLTVLAPFAVAKVQEASGSYTPALLGISVVTLIGGAACLLLMRERRGAHIGADGIAVAAESADVRV